MRQKALTGPRQSESGGRTLSEVAAFAAVCNAPLSEAKPVSKRDLGHPLKDWKLQLCRGELIASVRIEQAAETQAFEG
jgi:hypothetical protein